jgi:hypothetical protein
MTFTVRVKAEAPLGDNFIAFDLFPIAGPFVFNLGLNFTYKFIPVDGLDDLIFVDCYKHFLTFLPVLAHRQGAKGKLNAQP